MCAVLLTAKIVYTESMVLGSIQWVYVATHLYITSCLVLFGRYWNNKTGLRTPNFYLLRCYNKAFCKYSRTTTQYRPISNITRERKITKSTNIKGFFKGYNILFLAECEN